MDVTTRDGRRLRHRAHAVRGTPDDSRAPDEVEAKALDLMAPVLGAERAGKLAAQVWRIERLDSVLALRPLLQA